MALKIAVSPGGYDNIGEVLKGMGYAYDTLSEQTIAKPGGLTGYDVAFLNCAESCARWAKPATGALRDYVAAGGALYCSDYAADYVAAAFPGMVTFGGKSGGKGQMTARVLDVGLQGPVGLTLPLHFDLPGWVTIRSTAKGTETFLAAPDGAPLLVTFRHEKGEVIYTCFHNRAQPSEKEQLLLRFLVIKPLIARAKIGIEQFVVGKSLGTVENVGIVSPGQTSPDYFFDAKGNQDLRFLLNWVGEAELALEVFRPDGQLERRARAVTPPVEVEAAGAAPGRWRYRVSGHNVPERNFPYVLLVGPSTNVRVLDPFFMQTMNQRTAAAAPDANLLDAIEILDTPELPSIDIEIDIDL